MALPALVELLRGEVVESVHRGSLVVLDAGGSITLVVGDAEQPVFLRSAIKPFVAALVVRSGAADALALDAAEIAVAAGSHAGTDEDARLVRRLLERAGCTEGDLRNGSGGPADEATRVRLAAAGIEAGPVRQMCSGEHAAILGLACHAGWSTDGYWQEDHRAQAAIEELVGRLFSPERAPLRATDDCALPTWQVPLRSVARAFGWLARPEVLPSELDDYREPFLRVRDAMRAHPDRVSGPGELDTALTAPSAGCVAKEGAEGLLGVGSVSTGLALAVSVEDGDKTRRAAAVVSLAVLEHFGALAPGEAAQLRERHWPALVDPVGRSVGSARPAFRLPVGR